MTIAYKQKIIHNKICAQIQCTRPVDIRVKFSFGFSAGFCNDCAAKWVDSKIGTIAD